MTENLVAISKLSKTFDKQTALIDVTASIPKGQIVGLAGPDGAGKTTLIRLIAGLLLPTKGSITVAGFDTVKNQTALHERIGYMPQRFGLYEDLSVMQNLVLYADLKGVVGDDRKVQFDRLLNFTNLREFTNRLARNLSGGMKQKLGLACALLRKPTLLLLDEPSVGVDPISRRELWKMVEDLLKEGITILWSTAYLEEVERCHTVFLLQDGKLLFSGVPSELTSRVKERTFKLTEIAENRRGLLMEILKRKEVEDGVIQGCDLRFLLKDHVDFKTDKGQLIETPPRFEDAYIDILGGGPGGSSLLAEKSKNLGHDNKTVIEAHSLTKQYGSFTAAGQITFSVKRGEIFGLLGPNGAGKSTTFKMLCGLLKPTSGHARVLGYDLQKASSKARSHIGYMAQKFSLYTDLSVQQNLDFYAGIYGLSDEKQTEKIEQMIEIFSLKQYLNQSPRELPLGFKQRLALASAVMHEPDVLFLDEPTSGVDPITRREFWNHINGLVEKGVTVMITTHFMDEAEYCDRIGLVYQSQMITIGTPDELKAKAKTDKNPSPTLEEAFIALIEGHGQ